MRCAFFPSFFRAALCGPVLLALTLLPEAGAAQPKKKEREKAAAAEPADSRPVLMSVNGGGGESWKTTADLKAASDKGNPKAQAQYAEVLLRGEEGTPQNRPEAISLLEKAARAGEPSAAFRMGMLLDDGNGIAQDRPRAMQYFKAAAAGGATEAMHNIGAAYASARGARRDYAEALAWLIVAKKRGSESNAEQAVRDQIQKLRRPELLTTAEERAGEIDQELSSSTVVALLPPPPGADPAATIAPAKMATPPLAPAAAPTLLPPPAPSLPKVEPPKVMAPTP